MKYIENQKQIEELTEKFDQILQDIRFAFDSKDIKEDYASYLTNRLNQMYRELFGNLEFNDVEEIKKVKEYIESDFDSLINSIMENTENGEIDEIAQDVFCKKIQALKEEILGVRENNRGIRTHYEVNTEEALKASKNSDNYKEETELGPILE